MTVACSDETVSEAVRTLLDHGAIIRHGPSPNVETITTESPWSPSIDGLQASGLIDVGLTRAIFVLSIDSSVGEINTAKA